MQGERGDQGESGETGPQGERGTQGKKGATGDKGAKGVVGPKGMQGVKGDQGIKGVQGLRGETGTIPVYMDSLLRALESKIAVIDGLFESFEAKFGCVDASACTYNEIATVADNSCEYPERGYDCEGNITEPYIGMSAYGGVVFKLDDSGLHGMVTTLKDVDFVGWDTAVEVCKIYNDGNYDDWILPSLVELSEMYNSLGFGGLNGNVGKFADSNYWSSESSSSGKCNQSYVFSKTAGYINCETDNPNLFVRPVRSF